MKDKIYRAGIIPFIFIDGVIHMLFMRPSNANFGGDNLQIAKGRIDLGEEAEQTALREGFEELGLLESNINKIYNLGNFLGRTQIFLAEVKCKEDFCDFDFETGETKWLDESNYVNEIRDIHLYVVAEALIKIKKLENMSVQELT